LGLQEQISKRERIYRLQRYQCPRGVGAIRGKERDSGMILNTLPGLVSNGIDLLSRRPGPANPLTADLLRRLPRDRLGASYLGGAPQLGVSPPLRSALVRKSLWWGGPQGTPARRAGKRPCEEAPTGALSSRNLAALRAARQKPP